MRKISKKLMGEAGGKPPSQSSYLDAILRTKNKQAKDFGRASKTVSRKISRRGK